MDAYIAFPAFSLFTEYYCLTFLIWFLHFVLFLGESSPYFVPYLDIDYINLKGTL